MKQLFAISILIILSGCAPKSPKPDGQWSAIEVGDYIFDFPPDFNLVEEKGIDSYVGRIQGDSLQLYFDFGYYSDDFEPTPGEYLEKGLWRLSLSTRFMQNNITYDQTNIPKVDVLNIRPATTQDSTLGKGCDYVATCKHERTEFDFPVYLPQEIKQLEFIVDTFANQYRKIVLAKDPKKGITGVYLRDLYSYNASINNGLALSMSADELTKKQQEMVLKIFKTGRHKKERSR